MSNREELIEAAHAMCDEVTYMLGVARVTMDEATVRGKYAALIQKRDELRATLAADAPAVRKVKSRYKVCPACGSDKWWIYLGPKCELGIHDPWHLPDAFAGLPYRNQPSSLPTPAEAAPVAKCPTCGDEKDGGSFEVGEDRDGQSHYRDCLDRFHDNGSGRDSFIGTAEGIALRDGTSNLRYIVGKLYDETILPTPPASENGARERFVEAALAFHEIDSEYSARDKSCPCPSELMDRWDAAAAAERAAYDAYRASGGAA